MINPRQNSGYKFKTDAATYKKMMDICDKQYHKDYPHYADDVYPQLDKIGTENSLTKLYDTFLPVLDQTISGEGITELALKKLQQPKLLKNPPPRRHTIPEPSFLAMNSGHGHDVNRKHGKGGGTSRHIKIDEPPADYDIQAIPADFPDEIHNWLIAFFSHHFTTGSEGVTVFTNYVEHQLVQRRAIQHFILLPEMEKKLYLYQILREIPQQSGTGKKSKR